MPRAPPLIKTLEGSISIKKEMVTIESQVLCGVTPVQVRPNQVNIGQYSKSWIIHFKRKLANLRLDSDKSEPAIPFIRRHPTEQCQRCWGFHSTWSCTKDQRFGRCTGVHETIECQIRVPKCGNCVGPHESTSLYYMARPRR